MSRQLTATLTIPGRTSAAVWPLLVEPENLRGWLAEDAAVDLATGQFSFWGRYTPDTPGPLSGHMTLTSHTPAGDSGPAAELSFDWTLRGQPTQVRITLDAAGADTLVTVHHTALSERMTSKAAVHDYWYTALENLRLLALTGRRQALPEFGSSPGSTVLLEVEVRAPAEEVFRYLIDPGSMARIWNDTAITVDPVPGGVYDYGWPDGGPRSIVELDPPRLLSFTWRYLSETTDSLVTWRLREQGGVTLLSLEHSGIADDTTDNEEYRAGWFSFLAIIKGIVELGPAWTRIAITGSEHGEA